MQKGLAGEIIQMEKETRKKEMTFFVSESEHAQILAHKELSGVINMSAYLRKMAIDGHILKLDLPQVREMLAMLGRISGSLNQIAKRVNSTGRLYEEDLSEIKAQQKEIWDGVNAILERLEKLN